MVSGLSRVLGLGGGRVRVALVAEEFGDPVDRGHERQDVQARATGDQGADVMVVGPPHGHEPSGGRVLLGGPGAVGVGLLEGGVQDGLEPGPTQAGDHLVHYGVDLGGLRDGEGARGGGDPPGFPRGDTTGLHRLPEPRQAVAEVQGVGDQVPRAGRGGLQDCAQFGRTVAQHQRGTFTTHPHADQVRQPPPARLEVVDRRRRAFVRVQIRPAQGQPQQLDIGVPAGAQIRLRGHQHPQPILERPIEHTCESIGGV